MAEVDYDELASTLDGKAEVDFDALAKEHDGEEDLSQYDTGQGRASTFGSQLGRGFTSAILGAAGQAADLFSRSLVTNPMATALEIGRRASGLTPEQWEKGKRSAEEYAGLPEGALEKPMVAASDLAQSQVEKALPVNPAYQQDFFTSKVPQAVGQMAGIVVPALLTGGGSAVGESLPLVQGYLLGMKSGYDEADRQGVTDPAKREAMAHSYGAAEAAVERLGGVGAAEFTKKMMGEVARKGGESFLKVFSKVMAGEGGEEALTGELQDIAANVFGGGTKEAPPSFNPLDPEVLKKRAEEFALGAIAAAPIAGVAAYQDSRPAEPAKPATPPQLPPALIEGPNALAGPVNAPILPTDATGEAIAPSAVPTLPAGENAPQASVTTKEQALGPEPQPVISEQPPTPQVAAPALESPSVPAGASPASKEQQAWDSWNAERQKLDDEYEATEPHTPERKAAREKRSEWRDANPEPFDPKQPLKNVAFMANAESGFGFAVPDSGVDSKMGYTGNETTSPTGRRLAEVTDENGENRGWVDADSLRPEQADIFERNRRGTKDETFWQKRKAGKSTPQVAFPAAPEGTPTLTQVDANAIVAPSVEAATDAVTEAEQDLQEASRLNLSPNVISHLKRRLESARKAVVPVQVIGTNKTETVPASIPNAQGQLEPNEIPNAMAAAKAASQSTEQTNVKTSTVTAPADTGTPAPALQKGTQLPAEPGVQPTRGGEAAPSAPTSVIPEPVLLAAAGETSTPQTIATELKEYSNEERSAMAAELGIESVKPVDLANAIIAKHRPKSGSSFLGRLESWADRKAEEGRKRLASGMDPELLAAHAIRTARWIQENGQNVTKWAREMVAEFGDSIRRHLGRIWSAAKKALNMGVENYAKKNAIPITDEEEGKGYTEEQAAAFAGLVSDSIDRQVEQNKKPKKIESIIEAEKKGEEQERFAGESKDELLQILDAAIEDTMFGPQTTSKNDHPQQAAATVGLSPQDLEAGLREPLRQSVRRGRGQGLANMVEELMFEGQSPETKPVLRKAIRRLLGIRLVPMEAVDYLLTRGRPVMEFLGNPLPRKTRRRMVDPNAKHEFFVAPDSRFKTKLQEVVGFFLPRGNERQARAIDLESSEKDAVLKGKIEDVSDDVRIATEKQLLNVDGEIEEHEVWTDDTKERMAAKLDELYPNGWVMKASEGFGGNEIYARGPQVDQQQAGGVINTFENNVIRKQPYVVEAFDPGIAKPMAELRMHLIVENGKAKAIPYAIGGRYNFGPFLVDTPMTRTIESTVEEMFNQNVKGMKEGEIFGPDVLIRPDGSLAIVELNPINRATADLTEAPGYSGYMARPLWAASIVSYLRGEIPSTVSYARAAMRASKRRIAEIKNSDMDRHMGWLERTYRNTKDRIAFRAATIRYFGRWIEDFVDEIYSALQRTAGKVTQAMKDWMKGMMETEGGRPNESIRPPKRVMEDQYNERSSRQVRDLVRTNEATASEVLDLLAQTNNGFLGELAGHLFNLGEGQGLNARIRVSSRSTGSPYYDTYKNLIQVRKGDEENATVLVHEIIHALTNNKIPTVLETGIIEKGHEYLKALDQNLKNQSTSEPIKGIIRAYLDALDQLGLRDRLFDKDHGAFNKDPLKVTDPDVPYGLRNLDEFITGALTDEALRDTLKSLKSSYHPELSLWDQIKAFIRHLLRIPAKLYSVFDDVMEHSMELVASEERYTPSGKLKRTDQLTEQDRIYLDAVARGDMETAQRMVDREAKRAGYTETVYHGSPVDNITIFNDERAKRGGIFVTKSSDYAKAYTSETRRGTGDFGRVYKLYANFKNVGEGRHITEGHDIRVMSERETLEDAKERGLDTMSGYQLSHPRTIKILGRFEWPDSAIQLARRYGGFPTREYTTDGNTTIALQDFHHPERIDIWSKFLYENAQIINDIASHKSAPSEYVVFSPSQLKSADPVTYDDQGNVIPLSKRFNPESKDIRYAKPKPLREDGGKPPPIPPTSTTAPAPSAPTPPPLPKKLSPLPKEKRWWEKAGKGMSNFWEKIGKPVLSIADSIHRDIGNVFRLYGREEAKVAADAQQRTDLAFRGLKRVERNKSDARKLWTLMDSPEKRVEAVKLMQKHGATTEEIEQFNSLFGPEGAFQHFLKERRAAGLKLGEIGDEGQTYFPRKLRHDRMNEFMDWLNANDLRMDDDPAVNEMKRAKIDAWRKEIDTDIRDAELSEQKALKDGNLDLSNREGKRAARLKIKKSKGEALIKADAFFSKEEEIEMQGAALRRIAETRGKGGSMKQRRIAAALATEELADFYESPASALQNYIGEQARSIPAARIFGPRAYEMFKNATEPSEEAEIAKAIMDLDSTVLDVNTPLGKTVQDLKDRGELKSVEDFKKLREITSTILGHMPPYKAIQFIKNLNVPLVLANPISALKQIPSEFALAASKYGWGNAFKAAAQGLIKGWHNSGLIDAEKDLNISTSYEIAHRTDKLGAFAQTLLKLSGFRGADLFAANILTNTHLKYLQGLSKEKRMQEISKWKNVLDGEDKNLAAQEVSDAIGRGDFTSDNAKNVAYYGLTEDRPTGLASLPPTLLKARGLAQIPYFLKGWSLFNLDRHKRNIYDNLASGDPKRRAQAISHGLYLMSAMIIAGASADAAADWLLGKDVDFSADVHENLAKMFFASQYQQNKLFGQRPDFKGTLLNFMNTPALDVVDSMWKATVTSAKDDSKGFLDLIKKDKNIARVVPLGLGTIARARTGGAQEDEAKAIERRSEDSFSQLNKESARLKEMGEDARNRDRAKRERWAQLTAWGKVKSYHVKRAKEAASRGDYDAADRIMTELEAMAKRPWSWASAARGIPRES